MVFCELFRHSGCQGIGRSREEGAAKFGPATARGDRRSNLHTIQVLEIGSFD